MNKTLTNSHKKPAPLCEEQAFLLRKAIGMNVQEKLDLLSLLDRFNQPTIYFQINFQALDCIFGLFDIIERAGDNLVAAGFL